MDQELEAGPLGAPTHQVIDRHARMNAQVNDQSAQLSDRRASNELARVAAFNARERYRRAARHHAAATRKNVAELGELAGTTAEAVLPHLENDDIVLQAGLVVKFNFDGRARSASTTAKPRRPAGAEEPDPARRLMKDDETPGGFVFIDEPLPTWTCATSSWSATSCAQPAPSTC